MSGRPLPRMMLGFVVRRCAIDIGHAPSAAEFAEWANGRGQAERQHCLFGREISEVEAGLILRHRGRLVSARSASKCEQHVESPEAGERTSARIIPLAAARARRRRKP